MSDVPAHFFTGPDAVYCSADVPCPHCATVNRFAAPVRAGRDRGETWDACRKCGKILHSTIGILNNLVSVEIVTFD